MNPATRRRRPTPAPLTREQAIERIEHDLRDADPRARAFILDILRFGERVSSADLARRIRAAEP